MKFGTDGVRGVANRELTPEFAFKLGQAAGLAIDKKSVAIGRDTRRSGPMLGAALASGFCSVGVDVMTLGIVPTPTVAFVARHAGLGLGCVISASHNPAPDNGIKLLGGNGGKLPDAQEAAIQALLDQPVTNRPEGGGVGYLYADHDQISAYMTFLESVVPERLEGMKVAVDAANGAAYELGPDILRRLGAEVLLIGNQPDGMNINDECGATHPATIQDFTRANGAHVGVAFDGDADRAVFSDEVGELINGDRTIGAWAGYWRKHGGLEPPVVIGTVMSNGGFERYLTAEGIRLERVKVGDKYVSQGIERNQAKIGGEQSGHIIFPHHGPTGDGLVTMLEFLRVLKLSGQAASGVSKMYESMPQVLINVQIASREGWDLNAPVQAAIAAADQALAGTGRVSVRASGTQPMIRVMVEAETYALRDAQADAILAAMVSELGGKVYSKVDLTHALGD